MKRILYNVMGAGRSGTSLTANILSELGVYFGNDLLSGNIDNPNGFFEDKEIVMINDFIFYENDVFLFPERELHTSFTDDMGEVLKKFTEYDGSVGIKDPVLCWTRPLWTPVFEKEGYLERMVVVFRHPYEGALSLLKLSNHSKDLTRVRLLDFDYALLYWLSSNLHLLEQLLEFPKKDLLVLEHLDYFTDSEKQLEKINDFLEIKEKKKISGLIDNKLRRNDQIMIHREDSQLTCCVNDLYRFMRKLADGKADVTVEIIEKYRNCLNQLLRNYYCTIDKGKDIIDPTVLNWRKKVYCMMHLRDKSISQAVQQYFRSQNVSYISLYGNGDLAKLFYNILGDVQDIEITAIYDQSAGNKVTIGENTLSTMNWQDRQKLGAEELVINTIFYYSAVTEMLEKDISSEHIISLYDLFQDALALSER